MRQPNRRSVSHLALVAGAALAIAGCTTTTYNCSGSTCEVTLSGPGASTELGDGGPSITLVSIQDGRATIELAGDEGSCAEGDTIELAGSSVECTAVQEDSVELTIAG